MTFDEIRRDFQFQSSMVRINATNRSGRAFRSERDAVMIEDVGHLRISTAIRVSPTVIRVTLPRRKTTR
jgi:hypothetical protein